MLALQVKTFLNRLLGMAVDKQNVIFTKFTGILNEFIATAKEAGTFDEGVIANGLCELKYFLHICQYYFVFLSNHVHVCIYSIRWLI